MFSGVDSIYIDDLTGVLNRRYLYDHLGDEIERADREGSSLWMAMIDIDDFKAINDTYGHLEGDNILREVASIFRRVVRATDKVIRFGGDEFILLLIDGGFISALSVLRRIREYISHQRFSTGIAGLTIEVTISIGLAGYPDDTVDPERLLSLADEALYVAKSKGKASVALVSDIPNITLLSRDILELFPTKEIVDREEELGVIRDFFASKNDVVLEVSGDFGVGKTRLLKEAEKIGAMYSFLPFFSTTYGSQYPLIYDLWRYFENNYLDVYPDLLEKLPASTLEEIKTLEAKEDPQRIVSLVDELLRQVLTHYPVCFFIDDLLYADEDSLWTIVRLLSNFRHRTRVVFSVDSDVESDSIRSYLNMFESRFMVRLLSLKPFSRDTVGKWLKGIFGNPLMDKRIEELLYQVSRGNAMFLEEIVKYLMIKKFIYKVNQNWIFRSYEEIKAEIEGISFSELVRKRAQTLDEVLLGKLFNLSAQGKDVSEIWKQDIGVVRKGYLLDVVKAFHREKLLHDRSFFVEDYPNVAVQEIFSIISENQRGNFASLEIRKDITDELGEKLLKMFLEVNGRWRKVVEDKEYLPYLYTFLENLSQSGDLADQSKSLHHFSLSSNLLSAECANAIKNVFVRYPYLEISVERGVLLVNGGRLDLEDGLRKKILELFEKIEIDKVLFLFSSSQQDMISLMYAVYLRKTESLDYILIPGSILLNRSITPAQLRELLWEIVSWRQGGKEGDSLEELNLAERFAFLISLLVDVEYDELLVALNEFFTQNPYLYRMFLLGLFLRYPFWGFPPFVKYILNKITPQITAEELNLLYQHRLIPFQFIRAILRLCYGEVREDITRRFGEDIVKRIELSFPDKDQRCKAVLSMSDIDRWGELLFSGPESLVLNLASDVHMLNLLVDSFEMSFGDNLLLFEICPWVGKFVQALYAMGYSPLAKKLISSFLGSIFNLPFESDRILRALKDLLCILLEQEQDNHFVCKVLERLRDVKFSVYKRLIRDAEIASMGFKMIVRFFKAISEGRYENVDLVRSIFLLGSAPSRYFLRKLVLSEDISSFGYFDLFLARRLVGSHIPADKKEDVMLFLASYLDNNIWYVVRNAMELLSYIITPSEVGIFRPLINHSNERIRKRLVFILSRLGGKEAERILLEMLKIETNHEIQDRIYKVLKRSKDPEILAEVEELV